MGIKDLSKVIADNASNAVKLNEMKSYFGRKVCSIIRYFNTVCLGSHRCFHVFVSVSHRCQTRWSSVTVRIWRHDQVHLVYSHSFHTLLSSHIMGMFYRTIRMIDNGVKPCYVFDGKPPDMKSGELEKRTERR